MKRELNEIEYLNWVDSFFGAVSGPVGATVLTVYTIGGAMKLHLRGQATATTAELAAEATRAMALLSSGLESPAFVETIHH